VLNDALSIYFGDATPASAFVARWCVGAKVETAGRVFQLREDEPEPRGGAGLTKHAERAAASLAHTKRTGLYPRETQVVPIVSKPCGITRVSAVR